MPDLGLVCVSKEPWVFLVLGLLTITECEQLIIKAWQPFNTVPIRPFVTPKWDPKMWWSNKHGCAHSIWRVTYNPKKIQPLPQLPTGSFEPLELI